jgi:hypothetical protein
MPAGGQRGEVKLLVGHQFMVAVDTDEVPMATARDLVTGELDLATLESLAAAK